VEKKKTGEFYAAKIVSKPHLPDYDAYVRPNPLLRLLVKYVNLLL
jgi:hypothetical protein